MTFIGTATLTQMMPIRCSYTVINLATFWSAMKSEDIKRPGVQEIILPGYIRVWRNICKRKDWKWHHHVSSQRLWLITLIRLMLERLCIFLIMFTLGTSAQILSCMILVLTDLSPYIRLSRADTKCYTIQGTQMVLYPPLVPRRTLKIWASLLRQNGGHIHWISKSQAILKNMVALHLRLSMVLAIWHPSGKRLSPIIWCLIGSRENQFFDF